MAEDRIQISLAAARVNANLTQPEVAKALHVSVATIISWEKGRTEPSISQTRILSQLYNMPFDYIFLPDTSN